MPVGVHGGGGGGGMRRGGEEGGGGLLQCPREVALVFRATINVQHTFSKTPVYIIVSWEMAKQIGWWAMQPWLVACIWEGMKCWGAWGTACRHKPSAITPLISCRRGAERATLFFGGGGGWRGGREVKGVRGMGVNGGGGLRGRGLTLEWNLERCVRSICST